MKKLLALIATMIVFSCDGTTSPTASTETPPDTVYIVVSNSSMESVSSSSVSRSSITTYNENPTYDTIPAIENLLGVDAMFLDESALPSKQASGSVTLSGSNSIVTFDIGKHVTGNPFKTKIGVVITFKTPILASDVHGFFIDSITYTRPVDIKEIRDGAGVYIRTDTTYKIPDLARTVWRVYTNEGEVGVSELPTPVSDANNDGDILNIRGIFPYAYLTHKIQLNDGRVVPFICSTDACAITKLAFLLPFEGAGTGGKLIFNDVSVIIKK